jgi:hypothetical protein
MLKEWIWRCGMRNFDRSWWISGIFGSVRNKRCSVLESRCWFLSWRLAGCSPRVNTTPEKLLLVCSFMLITEVFKCDAELFLQMALLNCNLTLPSHLAFLFIHCFHPNSWGSQRSIICYHVNDISVLAFFIAGRLAHISRQWSWCNCNQRSVLGLLHDLTAAKKV